jgi:hypothetical protein
MRIEAYGQAVWFWLPDAGVNPRVKSPGGWWLKSPAHQEEHGAAVKPLRRECRVISAYLCWPACVFFVLHARQWVRSCTRHSLRPPSGGTRLSQNPDANRAAGMQRHVLYCRPGQASTLRRAAPSSRERDPGPIPTGRCAARSRTPESSPNQILWLWVPVFAGTTPNSCLARTPETRRQRPAAWGSLTPRRAAAFIYDETIQSRARQC